MLGVLIRSMAKEIMHLREDMANMGEEIMHLRKDMVSGFHRVGVALRAIRGDLDDHFSRRASFMRCTTKPRTHMKKSLP